MSRSWTQSVISILGRGLCSAGGFWFGPGGGSRSLGSPGSCVVAFALTSAPVHVVCLLISSVALSRILTPNFVGVELRLGFGGTTGLRLAASGPSASGLQRFGVSSGLPVDRPDRAGRADAASLAHIPNPQPHPRNNAHTRTHQPAPTPNNPKQQGSLPCTPTAGIVRVGRTFRPRNRQIRPRGVPRRRTVRLHLSAPPRFRARPPQLVRAGSFGRDYTAAGP